MNVRWYEVVAGEYEDEWSFFIYALTPARGSWVYSVRVYPKGCSLQDGPGAPLYLTLGAALAAVPSHVEEATKGV